MAAFASPIVKGGKGEDVNEPNPHYIKRDNINPKFPKSELKTEEEVDEYIEVLKQALKEQIKNNRRIQL